MPLYRLLAYTKPDTSSADLAELFRSVARLVYRERGQFRKIQNLGVRPLAYPHRRPREKYDSARFVECTYDLAPKGLAEVERLLKSEDSVLRCFHMRSEDELAKFKRGDKQEKPPKALTAAEKAQGEFNPATMEVER
jgi:small subunit ribosomal protein S6